MAESRERERERLMVLKELLVSLSPKISPALRIIS